MRLVARRAKARRRLIRALRRLPLYLAALAIGAFTLFPFYWMMVTAFRAPTEVLRNHTLWPGALTLSNFQNLLLRTSFGSYYENSLVVACLVTAGTLVVVPPVAYVLTRVRTRWSGLSSASVLLIYMYPETLLIVPIFAGLVRVHLDNNPIGLGLALLAVTTPMGLWLLMSFFSTLPQEVEQAAAVDGATTSQILWHIVVPMALPGFATVGMFAFIFAWVDYTFGLVLLSSDVRMTLPVGLASLFGQTTVDWGVVMAGSVLACVPLVLLMAVVGNYFIRGLTIGSVKG